MNKEIAGQTAIVTGAARGIGRGIGKRLKDEGCRVVVWDWDLSPLEKDEEFEPDQVSEVDVSKLDQVERAFDEAVAAFGDIQILVANAGVNGPVVPVPDYKLEDWDRVLSVNLNGVFHCCRAVVPHLRERNYGRIINVASIAGKEGMPNISAYSAAKAGAIGFCKALAKELHGTNVLVNSIIPVMTETELFKEMTQAHIDYCRGLIPMGRFPKIDEIAAMVAFMASPECSFNTGALFDMTGGRAVY
jgi:2-dehydro-3-deoxy-L-rhamnonate dehydrogenase (NAD+)